MNSTADEASAVPKTKVSELLVVPVADVDCRPAVDLLRRCASLWSPAVPVKVLADVEQIATGNDRHAILLHPGFAAILATRMMQGELPSVALASVTASIERILTHTRPLRRQVTVIDPYALVERPHDLIVALSSRLGVSGHEAISSDSTRLDDRADVFLLQVLAGAALARSPELEQLAMEIDAMTLGADAGKNKLGDLPDEAFKRFATVRRQMMDNATKADLLIEQVSQMEERLKSYDHEVAALNAQVATRAEDIRRLQKARNTFEARLREVHSSTSWRVTRPIRVIRKMISGKAAAGE